MPRRAAPLIAAAAALPRPSRGQDPPPGWAPNFASLGPYCWKDAPSANADLPRAGGCGCENTQFRWKGELMIMESHARGCDYVFQGYNSTARGGDCSYFRIRSMATGRVVANVSESIDHAFFSAVVDHAAPSAPRLWVFGSAHARVNKARPGPCGGDANWTGCYVGAWSSTDLVTWSAASEALKIPAHHIAAAGNWGGRAVDATAVTVFNVDVAFVRRPAGAPAAAPAHQAVMVLETRTDSAVPRGSIGSFAVNTGRDGDLSRGWELLPGADFAVSGETIPRQLNLGAPTVRHDDEQGYRKE
eukprot:gene2174-8526_t